MKSNMIDAIRCNDIQVLIDRKKHENIDVQLKEKRKRKPMKNVYNVELSVLGAGWPNQSSEEKKYLCINMISSAVYTSMESIKISINNPKNPKVCIYA